MELGELVPHFQRTMQVDIRHINFAMVYFDPCFLQCIDTILFNFAPFENTTINDNERYRYQLIIHIFNSIYVAILTSRSQLTLILT